MDNLGKLCLGMKEWYIPPEPSKISVDVVCVHGFAANPFWTWARKLPSKISNTSATEHPWEGKKSDKTGTGLPGEATSGEIVVWLRDFLPHHIPSARISTFGYESNYLKTAPKRDIDNCAHELLNALVRWRKSPDEISRPIIFLGHSFGGIVIKEAMIRATLAPRSFAPIKLSTKGVVFLGTPHRGASIASYGEILVTITRAVGMGSDKSLIHSLRNRSTELFKLATYFSDIYDDFDVFCFYELTPWRFSSVVVEQSSAVIEGKPSLGLTTDHSGLNKYTKSDDHNLLKIIGAITDMVARCTEKVSSEPALPKIEHWWENSAHLVERIDVAFDKHIMQLQSQNEARIQINVIAIQKYRFQAWAFAVGLLSMLEARQPLHHRFYQEDFGKMVCSVLEDIFVSLDAQNNGNLQASELAHSILAETLQSMLQRLVSFFSEEDGNITRNVFINRMLQPGTDEFVPTSFEPAEESTFQMYPDLEITAAMKRIKVLSEQSEAKRSHENPICIPFDNLQLEKTKSTSISTGTLLRNGSGVEDYQQIIVEWKQYTGFWDTNVGNELFRRVELLCEFLQSAAKGSKIMDLRILDFRGYCHDSKKTRLGFVYRVPTVMSPSPSYIRLSTMIKRYKDSKLNSPPVGDRMELAKTLCNAMFGFHRAGWFHKSFSSFNILYFVEFSITDPDDIVDFDAKDYSITAPYVVGFNNSRPSKPLEFSEPTGISKELQRYWHPNYKTVPLQKHKHEFDYYSLGIVLLEIGLWATLADLTDSRAIYEPVEFANMIRQSVCPLLRSSVGLIFEGVVLRLLDSANGNNDGTAENDLTPVAQLIQLQTDVLRDHGQCRA